EPLHHPGHVRPRERDAAHDVGHRRGTGARHGRRGGWASGRSLVHDGPVRPGHGPRGGGHAGRAVLRRGVRHRGQRLDDHHGRGSAPRRPRAGTPVAHPARGALVPHPARGPRL
ncbi:MAG: hypothetical protein AVDCRST_MAG79-1120, partial [uncultured Thermoleophilia bacterium]